jgi:protein O-GlcNAc transferase
MGNALKDSGKIDEAIACYTTAIQIRPQFPDAYSNLASAYKDGGRLDDAITCYRQALSLRPNFPDALSNLVHTLVMVCDWRTRDEDFAQLGKMIEEQLAQPDSLVAAQPFHGLVYPLTLQQQQNIAMRFAARCKVNVALLDFPAFRFRGKRSNERLRVGYVSSDFGNHPLAHLCQSIFGMHDRSRIEVYCFALTPNDGSPYRARIEREVEHFIDISTVQNGEAAKIIHSKQIHILVNLNGYTKGARNEIFALQPAPVQCSFMGFCGTLGADYVQYAVVDRVVVPEESQEFYTEKLIVMPDSYFANDHKQSARFVLDHKEEQATKVAVDVGSESDVAAASAGDVGQQSGGAKKASSSAPLREKYNIPEDKFVFANFNQCYKLDPETFRCWCRIVNGTPNSILWLLRFPALAESNLRAEAKKNGLNDDRLIFTDVEPREDHLKRGVLADLFLDTPVCNAHTTGCDILWSGTPMLTCMGSKMASRVAASLLRACGVEKELVTSSLEEYEKAAIDLGTNPNNVYDLRKRLEIARHTCPLFDTARWVENLEKGFELVWARHERGLIPANVFPDVRAGSE